MIVDRRAFFDSLRKSLFTKGFKQSQVDGLQLVLEAWEQSYQDRTPLTQLASVLGTDYHETAGTMQPIHEYGDRAYFMRMYDKTGARPDVAATLGNTDVGDGALFAGRGFPQLTGRANYRRATRRLRELGVIGPDVDFEKSPDLVMQPKYAIPIMFLGMEEGWFTGRKLDDIVDVKIDGDEHSDFVRARSIINGTDRAELIADHSDAFLAALKVAVRTGTPAPTPVPEPKPVDPAKGNPARPVEAEPPPVVAPTPKEPAPEGWFAHLLDLMRSHRRKA